MSQIKMETEPLLCLMLGILCGSCREARIPGSLRTSLLIVPPLSYVPPMRPFQAWPTDSSETGLHMKRGDVTLEIL